MPWAIIAHAFFARAGGGEALAVYAAKALSDLGFDVAFAASHKFDLGDLEKWFGVGFRGARTFHALPIKLVRFEEFQKFLIHRAVRKAVDALREVEAVFIDDELPRAVAELKRAKGFTLLNYIHFPYSLLVRGIPERFRAEVEQYFAKYFTRGGRLKPYYAAYLRLYSRYVVDNPVNHADAVFVNSVYTAKLFREAFGEEPIVLHPPVNVGDFAPVSNRGFEDRSDVVITVSRISPEKRIETVIRAVALTETRPRLRIVGSLLPRDKPYFEWLRELAGRLGVEVTFHVGVPRSELVKLLGDAKVYVHTVVGEHFGISVVEAMAAGLPVIVHRSGGPFEDITRFGEFGEVYSDEEELARLIDSLISDRSRWERFHAKSLERAVEYGVDRFLQRLGSALTKLV